MNEDKPEDGRGGHRPGSGRPFLSDEETKRVAITLPKSYVDDLRTIGNGNVSAGVRKLIEIWRQE